GCCAASWSAAACCAVQYGSPTRAPAPHVVREREHPRPARLHTLRIPVSPQHLSGTMQPASEAVGLPTPKSRPIPAGSRMAKPPGRPPPLHSFFLVVPPLTSR